MEVEIYDGRMLGMQFRNGTGIYPGSPPLGIQKSTDWVEGEPEESFWSGLKTSNRDTYAWQHIAAKRAAGWNFTQPNG